MNANSLSAIRTVLGQMTSEAKCREVYEAVLLSVREPSEAMFHRGSWAYEVAFSATRSRREAEAASFTAMIDALLAE